MRAPAREAIQQLQIQHDASSGRFLLPTAAAMLLA
jgi:hypothetical protein